MDSKKKGSVPVLPIVLYCRVSSGCSQLCWRTPTNFMVAVVGWELWHPSKLVCGNRWAIQHTQNQPLPSIANLKYPAKKTTLNTELGRSAEYAYSNKHVKDWNDTAHAGLTNDFGSSLLGSPTAGLTWSQLPWKEPWLKSMDVNFPSSFWYYGTKAFD